MALKRQRVDDPRGTSSTDYEIKSFGHESIHEVAKVGNPNFARGAFGEITIALRRRDTSADGVYEFVAIKTIEQAISSVGGVQSFTSQRQPPKLSRDVFNEVCALVHLNPHPNIVNLVAVYPSKSSFVSSTSLSLAFPYSPVDLHFTLEWRQRASLPPLGFDVVKAIAHDLFSALSHCHVLGVLHRDVKPGNLLVTPAGTIQLCDFGLAKPYLDEQSHPVSALLTPSPGEIGTKGLCTLFYRPPEVLLGGPANHPAIDMYSTGTTLAELVGGKPLLVGHNVMEQLSVVFDHLGTPNNIRWPDARLLPDYGKLEFATKEPRPWSQRLPRVLECQDLPEMLDRLVVLDPAQRMSAAQALEHPFFAELETSAIASLRSRLVVHELIPPSLQVPLLLAADDSTVMARLAVSMAAKRRTFLKTLTAWQGAELPTATLQDAIRVCC